MKTKAQKILDRANADWNKLNVRNNNGQLINQKDYDKFLDVCKIRKKEAKRLSKLGKI